MRKKGIKYVVILVALMSVLSLANKAEAGPFAGYYPALYTIWIDSDDDGFYDTFLVVSINFDPASFTLSDAEAIATTLESYFWYVEGYGVTFPNQYSPADLYPWYDGDDVVSIIQGIYMAAGYDIYTVLGVSTIYWSYLDSNNFRIDIWYDDMGWLIYTGSFEIPDYYLGF